MGSNKDWRKILGWSEVQLDELRITGYSYLRQGKYDLALPFFEALVIVDPGKPYNWQTLGALFLELGQPEKALGYLNKALEMDPKHSASLVNKSKALLELNQIDEGIAVAKKLKRDPDYRIASMARALILAYS
jgi:tetratricopeptide (TPR) repeat protein